jgi:hypothetical protein
MYTAHMPAAGSSQVAFHSPASRSRGINQCTFELYLKNLIFIYLFILN